MCRALRLVASALASAILVFGFWQQAAVRAEAPAGEVLVGTARIIDGDTLDIDGQRVRLHGIDAPESGQTCPGRREDWRCGEAATRELRRLAEGVLTCEGHERDQYGRLIGTCISAGRNINAEMVRSGYAWAFIKYSPDFAGHQREAQAAGAGIWAAGNPGDAPWDYRQNRWARATEAAPAGCAIKGNVSSGGRIYHVPWSPWYDKVSISPDRGERWFCDEAEAEAAGWRPARFE